MKFHPFNLRRRLIAQKYRKGDFQSVLSGAEKFLRKRPDDVPVLELKARAHTSLKNWEEGRKNYQKVVDLDPEYLDAKLQLARCAVYTKKWSTIDSIAEQDQNAVLSSNTFQQAISKKLQSLSIDEFVNFSKSKGISYPLPETALNRWTNLDFSQRPDKILPIDRYCLDNRIGGKYFGNMISKICEYSISEARNTLDYFVEKYPISLVSQWISPGLEDNSEFFQIITEWLVSYVNPRNISPQTLEALCVNEIVPPHVESIIREYLNHCTPLEIKNAIRVIGRKSDPRNYVSNDVIQQMISDGTGVSDSDPTIHTWMIEHMLRTQEFESLERIFLNQTKGILSPVLNVLTNLLAQENTSRLLELIALIVQTEFMMTNQKLRHKLARVLLKIAEPEIAHAFTMESILLEPQDAVSGLICLQASIKSANSKLILSTADIILNMRSRSNNINYSEIAIAAIREGHKEFAEQLLREIRLKGDASAHRVRIGLPFFEYKDYQKALVEIENTPAGFRSDHSIMLYEFYTCIKLRKFERALSTLNTITHPSEHAFASYILYHEMGEQEQAIGSINNLTETMGLEPFPRDWLCNGLDFASLGTKLRPQNQMNKHTELVSIIMTVHKWNKFLPLAINSILNQSHNNLELIVVDDCSPLDDLEMYNEIMQDERIRIIRMEENHGTYYCRNAGLRTAKGSYVSFADSDDWMHPQKVEYSLSTMKKESVDLLLNRFVRISEDGKIWFNGNKLTQFSLVGMTISMDAVKRFDLKFDGRARFGADSEFFERAKILLGPTKIKRTNFVELLALHHPDSLTGGGPNSIDWTGPGETRKRYTTSYRRNLELIESKEAPSNSMEFAPPQNERSAYVSPTHLRIRGIFDAEQIEQETKEKTKSSAKKTDGIHVFMATYPGGFDKLNDTVDCLLNQSMNFDKMIIHINGSKRPKDIPSNPRIEVRYSEINYADNGKFVHLAGASGYILTVDDDIRYPFDYIEKMVNAVESFGRSAIIGVHGAVLPVGPPITRWSGYKESRRTHVFSQSQASYSPVNVIGTGTMAYHSSIGIPDINAMNSLRMVDLHIAVWAQQKGISMYTLPREKNWMTEFEEIGDNRIWQQANENLELQNEMILTLSKVGDWGCNTIGKINIRNGPMKAHKDWVSRELPPNMQLSPIVSWPPLKSNPKVTIYIPAYNVENYIEECVDSALAQTYNNYEISIHDDGSTDNTWNILKSKYGNNPKIILNSLPNKGIGFATNSAIRNGDGELILQLDSDDLIEPETLSLLVEALQHGYVCAYGNFRRIHPDGTLIDNGWEAPEYSRFRLMKDMIIHPPRLYRRDVWEYIGQHNEKLVNAEDFDVFLRMSEVGDMVHVRKILYSYRILETSSTRSKSDIMTVNTHDVINSALERQGINKFELTVPNPNFPRRISFKHVSFSEL